LLAIIPLLSSSAHWDSERDWESASEWDSDDEWCGFLRDNQHLRERGFYDSSDVCNVILWLLIGFLGSLMHLPFHLAIQFWVPIAGVIGIVMLLLHILAPIILDAIINLILIVVKILSLSNTLFILHYGSSLS